MMVRAAATQAIDFSRADPRSMLWWKKLWITIDAIEQQDEATFHRLAFDRSVGMLVRLTEPGLPAQTWRAIYDAPLAHHEHIIGLLWPWSKDTGPKPKGDYNSLRDAWMREYGDMDDPKTQQAIAETVAFLKSQRKPVQIVE